MGIIQTNPGSPGANAGASGGKVYAFNAITNVSNTPVAPANPQRNAITFHNPGAQDILVSPTVALNFATGLAIPLTPTTAALGGGFRVFANGGSLTVTGECQQAWQALALAGTTNPLTVMDTNI
jgi:hypothetical protein